MNENIVSDKPPEESDFTQMWVIFAFGSWMCFSRIMKLESAVGLLYIIPYLLYVLVARKSDKSRFINGSGLAVFLLDMFSHMAATQSYDGEKNIPILLILSFNLLIYPMAYGYGQAYVKYHDRIEKTAGLTLGGIVIFSIGVSMATAVVRLLLSFFGLT